MIQTNVQGFSENVEFQNRKIHLEIMLGWTLDSLWETVSECITWKKLGIDHSETRFLNNLENSDILEFFS